MSRGYWERGVVSGISTEILLINQRKDRNSQTCTASDCNLFLDYTCECIWWTNVTNENWTRIDISRWGNSDEQWISQYVVKYLLIKIPLPRWFFFFFCPIYTWGSRDLKRADWHSGQQSWDSGRSSLSVEPMLWTTYPCNFPSYLGISVCSQCSSKIPQTRWLFP